MRQSEAIEAILVLLEMCGEAARKQDGKLAGRSGLQRLQRWNEPLLDFGKIGAEGECGKESGVYRRLERALDGFRSVVTDIVRQRERPLDLSRILGLLQQLVLKARVGDRQHSGDHIAVAFAANVGDAVLGDDNVAQMPWNS